MRKANVVVLALFSVFSFAAPLALGQGGSTEQQISALSDQLIQAQLKAETSFFEKNYADDATIVHGNGKLFTRAEEIADLKSGSLKYESVDVRDKKIHVFGDTAVAAFLLSFTGTLGGKPFSGVELRRTVVWVKQKDSWKIALYQVTRLASQ